MRLIALGLALLLALPGLAQAGPFRLIITDMEPPLVPNSVIDIALSEGYFTRAGVEVELVRVQQTPMALAALQSGEGEMANVATEGLLRLAARPNSTLRAVMTPSKSLPYLIAGRQGMTLEGLRGQAFAIGRIGSLDHLLAQKVLEAKGIMPGDLRMLALGQPAVRAQALAAGQIGATAMSAGSYLSLPGHQDLPVLVSVADFYAAAPVVSKVNAVTAATLDSRGAEVEAVITALTLAARDLAASPGAWAKAMAKLRPDVDPAVLDRLGADFQSGWSVNGGLQAGELRATANWLYASEDFRGLARADLQDWVDFGPLDRVLAKIGIFPAGDPVTR